MIISASRKTDLPTFYGEWFRNRLRAGYCKMVNAYNRRQHRTVSLQPEDVDGFVFWTKNLGPFLPALADVTERGVPFLVQYTINTYPKELEASVLDTSRAVEHCRRVADEYGSRVLVWRYDPIVVSDLTPLDWHLNRFADLAESLSGCLDEVIVKFANFYRKTKRNLSRAASERGFEWWEPTVEQKMDLLRQMADIAAAQRLRLSLCSQPELLVDGVEKASCIDAARLTDVAGRPIHAVTKGVRPGCECAAAVDIGEYDTCPHGCVYCYAVERRQAALDRYRHRHDPQAEYLIVPANTGSVAEQLSLF